MVRPYDPDEDADALWTLKEAFELGLGSGTGGEAKAAVYREKLDRAYRDRYLEWVAWCIDREPRAVQVAVASDSGETLAGYVFVLPAELAMIWDAAVLNEIYVEPAHRGTGVADDLMDAAVAVAADQDLPLPRLVLDVDRANERARAFYRRHGFDHWGELVARPLD